MTAPGRDHFSESAAAYAAFRPRYPAALFAWIAEQVADRGRAWDCATGSGQAAVGLAEHFREVVASDASVALLGEAEGHARVRYVACAAERAALRSGSVSLVTVAQALHWLELEPFYAEVRRVLVPGGLVAVWCYGLLELEGEIGEVVRRFEGEVVGPYWPPERALVDSGYATVPFPFAELAAPSFAIERRWTLAELAGYVGTWSAVRQYRRARGEDPMPGLVRELAGRWGDGATARHVRWPVRVRAGRVS
jgi:SAM-dependent methyltransferase